MELRLRLPLVILVTRFRWPKTLDADKGLSAKGKRHRKDEYVALSAVLTRAARHWGLQSPRPREPYHAMLRPCEAAASPGKQWADPLG